MTLKRQHVGPSGINVFDLFSFSCKMRQPGIPGRRAPFTFKKTLVRQREFPLQPKDAKDVTRGRRANWARPLR